MPFHCFLSFLQFHPFPVCVPCQMKLFSLHLQALPPQAFYLCFIYTLNWGTNALQPNTLPYPLFLPFSIPICLNSQTSLYSITSFHWELHCWIDDLFQRSPRQSISCVLCVRNGEKICVQIRWNNESIFHCRVLNPGTKVYNPSLWLNTYSSIYMKFWGELILLKKMQCFWNVFYNMTGAFYRFKSKHSVSITIITSEKGAAIVFVIFNSNVTA